MLTRSAPPAGRATGARPSSRDCRVSGAPTAVHRDRHRHRRCETREQTSTQRAGPACPLHGSTAPAPVAEGAGVATGVGGELLYPEPRTVRIGPGAQLLPHLGDVDVDRSRATGELDPPDAVEQPLPGHHEAGVVEQEREQVELLARQLYRTAGDRNRPPAALEHESPPETTSPPRLRAPRGAAPHGPAQRAPAGRTASSRSRRRRARAL